MKATIKGMTGNRGTLRDDTDFGISRKVFKIAYKYTKVIKEEQENELKDG